MNYCVNPRYGPINCSQWWAGQVMIFMFALLALFIVSVLAQTADLKAIGNGTVESSIFIFVFIGAAFSNFATCMNRLEHSGRSRWWYAVFLVPIIGTGLMIIFCGMEEGEAKVRQRYVPKSDMEWDSTKYRRQEQKPSLSEKRYKPRFGRRGWWNKTTA